MTCCGVGGTIMEQTIVNVANAALANTYTSWRDEAYVPNPDNGSGCTVTSGSSPNCIFSPGGTANGGFGPADIICATASGNCKGGGKTGNGLQTLQPVDNCGYPQTGWGYTSDLYHLGTQNINIMNIEWDELLVTGWSSTASTIAKIGTFNLIDNPSVDNNFFYNVGELIINYADSPLYYSGEIQGRGYTTYDSTSALYNASNSTANPCPGCMTTNTWYHFRQQIAVGPNGWIKTWITDPNKYSGQPVLMSSVTRMSTSTGVVATAAQAATFSRNQFDIYSHFGGCGGAGCGTNSPGGNCATTNSYQIYDNLHVTGYRR
jgi:hypothetical protein